MLTNSNSNCKAPHDLKPSFYINRRQPANFLYTHSRSAFSLAVYACHVYPFCSSGKKKVCTLNPLKSSTGDMPYQLFNCRPTQKYQCWVVFVSACVNKCMCRLCV